MECPAFLPSSISALTLTDFTVQANSWRQMQITTAHVALGSLILAVSTVLALRGLRFCRWQSTDSNRIAASRSFPGVAA